MNIKQKENIISLNITYTKGSSKKREIVFRNFDITKLSRFCSVCYSENTFIKNISPVIFFNGFYKRFFNIQE